MILGLWGLDLRKGCLLILSELVMLAFCYVIDMPKVSSLAGIVAVVTMGFTRIKYLPYKLVPLVPTVDPQSVRQEKSWTVFIIPMFAVMATFILRLRDGVYSSDPSGIYFIGAYLLSMALWSLAEGVIRIRTAL
jgi:hypothetical protein